MSGAPDNERRPVKPFLIAKDEEGHIRLTVRETHYNSQGYPIVTASQVDEVFETANTARAHARTHLGARPGQFATK